MKKETNKSLKFIVIYILSILIVIISASIFSERMVMAVADTSKVIIQHAVNASGGAIAPQHTGHYVPHEIYENYASRGPFPLTNLSFNLSWDFFCSQHGTPYGRDDLAIAIGNGNEYGGDIYRKYKITGHKSDHTKPDGDVPDPGTVQYYLDKNGNWREGSLHPSDFTYPNYKDNEEVPAGFTQQVFTNWVYVKEDYNFDCENGCTASSFASGCNDISHGGFAFTLAVKQYKGTRTINYREDPIQWLEWRWLGYDAPAAYEGIVTGYDAYHEFAENMASGEDPLYIEPDEHVGTELNGTSYQVGPFTMSDYSRLEDFGIDGVKYNKGDPLENMSCSQAYYDSLPDYEKPEWTYIGGGRYQIRALSDINIAAENLQSMVFNNYQGADYSAMYGGIIKVDAILTNKSDATTSVTLCNYFGSNVDGNEIPDPKESDVYFNIPGNYISPDTYDELKSLKFTYRIIHSCGSGTYYKGEQDVVTFEETDYEESGCSYTATCTSQPYGDDCDMTLEDEYYETGPDGLEGGGPSIYQPHSHYYDCDDHDEGCGCDGHEEEDGTDEEGNPTYTTVYYDDCNCGCEGHYYTECDAENDFTCRHGYHQCRSIEMGLSGHSGDYCQDGNCVRGDLWYEDVTFEVPVNVPLITQMEIYKYISNVEHEGDLGQIFPSRGEDKYPLSGRTAEERREMWDTEKEANPVPVERGDYVTYTIELVNDSRFPTKVKVEDILPDGGEAVRIVPVGGEYETLVEGDGDGDFEMGGHEATYIRILPESTNKFEVVVRPNKDEGIYTNTAKFKTMNGTDEKMLYEEWGEESISGAHTDGSIVNYYEFLDDKRMEDSDTYIIKEYHVGIDKYIHDVSHEAHNLEIEGLEDNTFGPSDERTREHDAFTEEQKEASPVYAEFGDTVEYLIKIYNTNNQLVADVNREEDPYYNPDCIYVDIDDELPKKFSHMEIEIDNQDGNSPSYTNPVESTNGGKIEFRDVKVPKDGVTTITIRMVVEEHEKATIERNYVKFVNEIHNINYTDEHIDDDEMNAVKNNADDKYVESKEYYIIDNYNVFMEKFVSNYDELVTHENNDANFTAEDYLTEGEDNHLKESRESGTSPDGPNEGVTEQQKPAGYNRAPLTDQVRSITPKEEFKENYPLGVEQREHITYTIKITNDAKEVSAPSPSGVKYATQARPEEIIDMMQVGITQENVTATIVDASGNQVAGERGTVDITIQDNGEVSEDGVTYHQYSYTTPEYAILNPGESLVIKVECVIDQSNYYLLKLRNKAYFKNLTNINHYSGNDRHVQKDDEYSENIAKQIETSEYVRMKDLVIAGKVWLDYNKDGLLNDSGVTDEMKKWYNISSSAQNGEKQDIPVKLYRVVNGEGELLRTTKTDASGLFTFGRDQLLNYYTSEYNYDGAAGNHKYDGGLTYQRIPKCDPSSYKDQYGNYTESAKYQDYYIEYEYDGVIYKSTVEYANQNNLNKENGDLANDNYKIDSNAYEFVDVRDEFNTKYEYISYNIAYDSSKANPATLVFDKEGHTSELIEDSTRAMKSRSFIKGTDLEESIENTDLLWLYKHPEPGDEFIPYTEHLKYINLGLELREDVDIALVKDVYKVKTTVNGDEMEYSYNQVDGVNGDMETSGYLNNYIINEPYGLEIYNEDYTYRVDQYFAQAVKDYKTQNTELNIEVTYRLSIHNRPTKDDERVPIGQSRDTKLDVKISEIMDLYDENFMKYNDNPSETVTVRVNGQRGADGETQLEDKKLKIAEAWYFEENGDGEKYRLSTNSNGSNGQPIYELDPAGTYAKKELTLSNSSLYSQRTDIQELSNAQGYNALYITGMEGVLIPEGGQLDIYVKYIVDKDKLAVENQNERFEEHINPTDTTLTFSSDGVHYSYAWETTGGDTTKHAYLERSLKLFERNATDNGETERFLEGIGQVNMYSVWYADDESNGYFRGHEASLVDRDSNAGNIALGDIDAQSLNGVPQYLNPTSPEEAMTSVDNIDSYDDTAYKTGISVYADILEETETYTPYHRGGGGEGEITPPPPIRKISGKVWDDTRSEMVGDNIEEYQYVGNGKYSENDHVISQEVNGETRPIPKINDNVPLNYHNSSARSSNNEYIDEMTDILVRNAKVELVEIVPIKVGNEYHYYEEVKGNQIADIIQNYRTNERGEYELRGFAPGKYIVRYTYGDTVDPSIRNYTTTIGQVQEDMVVFNGQDYKSTQYNSVLDSITDPDEIILGLEQPNVSDARDDEIRRLEVISYSEVMNNRIAEVLKGSANRAPVSATEMSLADTFRRRMRQAIGNGGDALRYGLLSPQTPALEGEELTNMYDELTDNTYMQAETVEFTVRTEKLTDSQIPAYDERKVMTIDYNNIAASDIEQYYNDFKDMLINHIAARDYSIENVDFGIEYRPEAEISLVKEVSEVKIKTASRVDKSNDDNVLIDLKFLTREPTDGDKVVHYLDEVNSKGLELLQFISNTYAENYILENLIVANENRQGLIYIQVDDEVLQGSTIEITYRFFAENDSEIDRISPHLNDIRYRNNAATRALQDEYNADVTMTVISGALTEGPLASPDYRASGTGANVMRRDFYNIDGNSYPYRNSRKMMVATATGSQLDFSDGYFGKYLGAVYYKGAGQDEVPDIAATGGDTGKLVNVKDGYKGYDEIAPLKFTKVIDYVDTGLEYVQDTSITDELLNRNWYRVTEDQLKDYVFEIREQHNNGVADADLRLLDPDGLRYKPVVTIDDRQQDPVDGNFDNETPKVTNFSLSRFLLPDITIEQNHTRTAGVPKYPNYEDKFDMINGSTAEFYIPVSKVIASETDTEDMVYENLSEVIEFVTLTGRRTNFAATIGNASIQDTVRKYSSAQIRELGTPEFFTAALEADQASVETITLTPPTGLQRFNKPSIISPDNPVQTGINLTLIAAAVAILGIGGSKIATTLYAKRRIK